MSQKSIVNVELKHHPLYPWYPARYKNRFNLAYGPDYQRITSKVFTFYYYFYIYI